MPSFANSALRLLRRLLGAPTRSSGAYAGELTALDGSTAVAVTEAAIAESAGLGASFPVETADVAWRTQQRHPGRNLLGTVLDSQLAEGPRGALASAVGSTMGGARATAFLSAPDLGAAQDLLHLAAGRRLPLVAHLATRALPGHAVAIGSGHEACHQAADSGAFLLFASNVQEAVDLTLIARRVAEETLTPGLVIMDGDRTALAMQEVRLPSADLVTRFLGAPGDSIPAPTEVQRLLFGEQRRRVPRWHDLDRPVLLGALQTPDIWGLGAAAADVYFESQVQASLERVVTEFRQQTGRGCEPVSSFRTEDARLILVAQGAAVETAQAVAEYLRRTERLKVGVLGIRCLRPFPSDALLESLGSAKQILVLERLHTPFAGDPPLLRELRAAIDRALDDTSPGSDRSHRGLRHRDRLRLRSVVYGLGGLPLRGADLMRLCRQARSLEGSQIYLGLELAPPRSDYPKRQVLLDRLGRDYPEVRGLGLRSRDTTPDMRPAGSYTIAVHRLSGQGKAGLATEAAGFLHRLSGEHLRSYPALFAQPLGSHCIDRFTLSKKQLRDLGASIPVDLALLALDSSGIGVNPLMGLQPHGALLVQGPEQDGVLWQALSPRLQLALHGAFVSLYAAPPSSSSSEDLLLGAMCGVLVDKGWLDLSPRRLISSRAEQLSDAGDPSQETRLELFKAGLEAVRRVDFRKLPAARSEEPPEQEAPASVRRLGKVDDVYDNLPRFWDQVGVLFQDGAISQLSPDPYMAIGAVPPLLSAFRDLSSLRASLPHLDPSLCTGCGRCWTGCPDGAWGAVAATSGATLTAAIAAAEAGALRPIASKLSERIDHICRTEDASASDFGSLTREAYAWLQDKMPLPEERKQTMDAAAERLASRLSGLPAVVTAPFFTTPDSESKGDGALLFLALNPNDCKGCGICVHACPAGALRSDPQTTQEVDQVKRIWKAWEMLPDTAAEIINRAAANEDVGPLSATLLARPAARALAGGDGAEAGSGERLALRLALAVAEARRERRRKGFAQEVRDTHKAITGLIRTILSDALPADDLEALARRLETVSTRQADLGAFLGQAESAVESAVDAARLRRLVELARGLGDLTWRLEEGYQGLGRADLGLVLAGGEAASWAGVFPYNAFQSPVTLDATGEGARLAAGLLESQLRQAIEGFVLLRRARLELDKPMDAVRLWSGLAALTWRDLTPKEREHCPTMLLVGSGQVLAKAGLSKIASLLGGGLPLKILVLADLDLGLSTHCDLESAPVPAPDMELGLLALAHRDAYIAQTSLGAPTHFLENLEAGLDFDGPALFHVHAPSPQRHGFPAARTLERASLGVASRAFPLFRYDPKGEGVFGTRIDLGGNPEPLDTWSGKAEKQVVTPAHWALAETRFRDWIKPLAEDAPDPLSLDAYLELPERERLGHTAFVLQARPQQEPMRFAVAPAMVEACRKRRDTWRMLQELAGLVTPFTERVRREADDAVAASRRAELEAQAADYERKLAALREELQQELRGDIRARLMAMAGYRYQPEEQRRQ